MKRLIALALFSSLLSMLPADEYRFVINSGHASPSNYLHFHQDTRYYISVSDKGELLLLAPDEQRVVKRIELTQSRILDLRFNDSNTEMAYVSYSDLKFYLEVWDWHRGVILYSMELEDRPLFMEYTMGGNYLCLGQSSMPTVVWLDHRTGDPVDRTPNMSQLLQDVYIGASENNLMGYDLSGRLRYYDARDGRVLGEVSTMSNFREIEVLQTGNKTITVGITDQSFHMVDRQSGSVLDSLDQDNRICYNLDTTRGLLSTLVVDRGNYYLNSYDLTEGTFSENEERTLIGRDLDISSLQDMGSIVLFGTNQGDFLFYYRDSHEIQPFFMEDVLEIQGIAGGDERLHIATDSGLISLESPYFSRNGDWEDFQNIRQYNQPYPHRGQYQLFSYNEMIYLASDYEDQPSPLLFINQEDLLERIPSLAEQTISLTALDVIDNSLAYIANDSTINLYDYSSGERIFQWANPAVKDMLLLGEETILIGKGSSPDNPGALMQINFQTEEITPLGDSLFYALDFLRLDNGDVYILGLESGEDGIVTVLQKLDNQEGNRLITKLTIPLEHYDSRLYQQGGDIYITLGDHGLIRYNGRRSQHLLQNVEVKDLAFVNNHMVILLQNNTLAFLDTRENVEFYQNFFSDLSWLAVHESNESYYYTQGARDNFFVYRVIRR